MKMLLFFFLVPLQGKPSSSKGTLVSRAPCMRFLL